LTIVVVLTMSVMFNSRIAAELARTNAEHQQVLKTRERLHGTLANQIGDRLESDLREIAAVPQTFATMLEQKPVWDEAIVKSAMCDALLKSPNVFGMGVALEPYAWSPTQRDYALYVYREDGKIITCQLVPPFYVPIYRDREWYAAARDAQHGYWCEPYVAEESGGTPMVTFSAPIRRNGQFLGVVSADLAIDYFRNMRESIKRLDLGPDTYGVVVTKHGVILSHPDPKYQYPGPKSNLKAIPLDSSVRELLPRIPKEEDGIGVATDPMSGKLATYFFSHISPSDWTFLIIKVNTPEENAALAAAAAMAEKKP
jgi:phosphoserine phosphatase RsbU/P